MRLLPGSHRVLDYRLATLKAMLVSQPLEDSLGRMPLLLGCLTVLFQNLVDDRQERLQLPLRPRLALPLTGRLGMRQNLLQRVPTKVVLLTRSTPAQLLRQHQPTDLFPKLHVASHSWASL